MSDIKIVLIGPGGVGKTTLRKVFFDHENPYDLIQGTLEPTIGLETTFYSLGNMIAIHDLAGQQMNYWIENAQENLMGTDLIISIFDCRDKWSENIDNVIRIEKVRKEICPLSEHVVFIHKIDLINKDLQEELQSEIDEINKINNSFTIFLSSFSEEYFMGTFAKFSKILKRVLLRLNSFNYAATLIRAEIIQQFSNKDSMKLDLIASKLKVENKVIIPIIEELEEKGIVNFNIDTEVISLSEYGKELLGNLKQKIDIHVKEAISPAKDNYIKALIIAEKHGRVFFTYQVSNDFFQEKFPENENDEETVSTLISMFFTAISDFSSQLDRKGITNIRIAGKILDVFFFGYKNIFGIFFIERIKKEASIVKILRQIIRDIYNETEKEINLFIKSGRIAPKLMEYKDIILNKIRIANENIKIVKEVDSSISQEELFKLYEAVTMRNFDAINIDLLKNLLFKHIIEESTFVIDQFYESSMES